MTLLNVLSVSVTVVALLLLGFYGRALYLYQRSLVDRALLTRVSASCSDAMDLGKRWVPDRLKEAPRRPGAKTVFARIEVGVKVGLQAGSWVNVPAEGTVEGDAVLAPHRLCVGRPPAGGGALEGVLPRALFEKLGGAPATQGRPPPGCVWKCGGRRTARPRRRR